MMPPTVVCNNILKRSFSSGYDVSPMKLQKLMYFVACEYQKATGTALFSEPFEVWRYGPVLRSVYDEFKSYGKDKISSYAKDAKGISYVVNEKTAPNLAKAIEKIWQSFKNWDAIPLSTITHEEGSGWSEAYDSDEMFITEEQMKGDHTYERYFVPA